MIQTRLARAPRWAALLIVAAFAALITAGSMQAAPPSPAVQAARHAGQRSDVGLYRSILADVEHGQAYYPSAAQEQRAHDFPVWPPQVIREPTEAMVLAALHSEALAHGVLISLGVLAVVSLYFALTRSALTDRERLWTLGLGAVSLTCLFTGPSIFMHEIWASQFLLLSLTLRRDARWGLSITAGLAACAFREIALPYLFVMAGYAACERRWKEAAGWTAAIGAFAALFAAHLGLAAAQHHPGDPSSQGWIRFGGLGFVLATARSNALLVHLPNGVLAGVLGLSLIGLLARRDALTGRCAATLIVYFALFCVAGRPENDYWGYLYAPLLPLGLALAPRALRDLWFGAKDGAAGGGRAWRALTSSVS